MKTHTPPLSGAGHARPSLLALTFLFFSFLLLGTAMAQPCVGPQYDDLQFQLLPCQELNMLDCGFCPECELQFLCVATMTGFQLDHFDQDISCVDGVSHEGVPNFYFTYEWTVNTVPVSPSTGQCLNVSALNFGDIVCVDVQVRAEGTGTNQAPLCVIPFCYTLEDLCDTGGTDCCDPTQSTLQNGEFNPANIACIPANNTSPFFAGCIPSWRATHGSPQVFGVGSDPFAWMWARDGVGEGIVNIAAPLNLLTQQGATYALEFNARGNGVTGNAFIRLANGVPLNGIPFSTGTAPPAVPANAQTLWATDVASLTTTGWDNFCIVFTATSNFTQLWIYPQKNPGGQSELAVDKVCLQRIGGLRGGEDGGTRRKYNGMENAEEFVLYPNPATSVLHFSYQVEGSATAELVDLTGSQVWKQSLDANQQEVEIPLYSLSKGIYLFRVEEQGTLIYQKKLVIKE